MPIQTKCPGCKTELRVRDEYIGKKLKCPRCSEVLTVPALTVDSVAEKVFDAQLIAPPAEPTAVPAVLVDVEPARSRRPSCPRCGEPLRMDDDRCPRCKLWLDDRTPRRRQVNYRPCPKCGGEDPTKVTWTLWGSFYGPALFNHVRCRECGYSYNGLNGKSNFVPAFFFVAVPAILIVAIIVGLLFVLGVFGGRRW